MKQFRVYDIIRRPLVTEKTTMLAALNKVVVEVSAISTKADVKRAFTALFNVTPTKVNMITIPGKRKRFRGRLGVRSDQRKAVVTLPEGKTVDFSSVGN
jgi:large subunit ribosomal protein L23